MKKFLLIALLSCMLLLALGCAKDNTPDYTADLPTADIAAAALSVLPSAEQLTEADSDYATYRLLLTDDLTTDYTVYIQNAGTSIDEFGIIRSATADTAALQKAVADFLLRRNEEWTGQYLVEEYPKLRDASYMVYGEYVVYTILSESDKTTFLEAVAQTLSENS